MSNGPEIEPDGNPTERDETIAHRDPARGGLLADYDAGRVQDFFPAVQNMSRVDFPRLSCAVQTRTFAKKRPNDCPIRGTTCEGRSPNRAAAQGCDGQGRTGVGPETLSR